VISQSGGSDDLLECTVMARRAGARTVALINDTSSALANACDIVLPMAAGAERSVAATKSFVATLRILLELVATWTSDHVLGEAIERLPDRLAAAARLDWSAALELFANTATLLTLGRGPTLALAREAALKLKETCLIHAEAFSGPEFLHGPIALVSKHCPVLIFMPNDAAGPGLREIAGRVGTTSDAIFVAEPGAPCRNRLPVLTPDHPDTDAVCLIQSFYAFVVSLAQRRGTDADHPPNLQKITRTR
jgi:glucosamine--fructose-6-phosphate aminotransferase (isomerizing)